MSVLASAPAAESPSRETRLLLTMPDCPAGSEFLVLGVAGGAAISSSGDAVRATDVGGWVVFARIVQRTSSSVAELEQRLTAFGSGPGYASASLPAGQPGGTSAMSTQMVVGILGLAGYKGGPARFRVDVTGACGTYSVR